MINTAIKIKSKKTKLRVFDYFNYIFLFFFSLFTLYPMFYVLIGSLNQGLDYISGGVYLWPRKFTLDNFIVIFKDQVLWRSYLMTILRTVVGTVTALLYTCAVGYAMSRRELKFRSAIYWFSIFTMFFGGGLIPYFLIINMLGLFDSFWVYIIPGVYSVYNMIIVQNFFKSVPDELHESAIVDGASEYRIYFQIYIPLSKPVIATLALWIGVGHWNSFFDTMVYVRSESLWTLQYYLMKIINNASIATDGVPLPPEILNNITPQTVTYAAIIVSIIPIMCIYPFLQKHFAKGIMIGSLKG